MKTRTNSKKIIVAIAVCLIISLLIKLASYYPLWIEKNYSRGLYPHISWFYRAGLGWIPFSLGDLLYLAGGVFLLVKAIQLVKIIVTGEIRQTNYKKRILETVLVVMAVYVYFNLSWGLNYNRPGIEYQLQLSRESQNEEDLKMITGILLKKVNENRLQLGKSVQVKPYHEIFTQAKAAYEVAAGTFPFLQYNTISVKKSLYGRMGNFLGFLGYYNPFTGEAQVNLTQPRFLIPYVSCHEMAHQLGYASESEANFIGYLAAINSPEIVFHYSAYFDLFNYANNELFIRDSVAAKDNYRHLDTLVKKDEIELRQYWLKSDNVIEPIIKVFYDHYLKANQQSKGLKSYNEVVGWLISYYNKYGII